MYSQVVMRLLFDYESMRKDEIITQVRKLPRKIIRWLGSHHPDNRTRKVFFRETGVYIGKDTNITAGLIINDNYSGLCRIGSRVSIATNVTIVVDSNPNNSILSEEPHVKENLIVTKPVVIEDDVWIGTNVVILPGVTIGRGSVIGAGAIVSQSIPPFSVAAGVPARIVRRLQHVDGMTRVQHKLEKQY